ncbi:MAG: histidine ammonia-lyase, partial [Chloroflexi bacterium]|nr:histidine ammonia-lyase [Chloroflexota bacterium]
VALDRGSEHRMADAARLVTRLAEGETAIYGVNTGYGDLAQVRVAPADLRALQRNLVRSHSVAVGEPLALDVVRAVLLLRAHTLATGRSGVRPETVHLLLDMLNRGVLPVIPRHGSVGASGDLAPLAHAALAMIGEGEAFHDGKRKSAGDALRHAGLRPIELAPKEGLSLVNGTQVMTAVGCLALHDAEVLATTADVVGALTAEALRSTDAPWTQALHDARPHPGQRVVASNLRALVDGSSILASHRMDDPRVQDPYSVRCMPQVHGATRDALAYVRRVLEIEVNAVTDNPLVFAEDGRVVSGGNFHGQPVAIALDLATIATAELADISEARIDRITNGHTSGLPPFLAREPGRNSGYMVAQYTAAALVAENRLRAFPASVESVPTSAGMEDHVSMGLHAALKLADVVRNTRDVLAIESLCAAQGMDLLGMRSTAALEEARRVIREHVPTLDEDRALSGEVATMSDVIAREVLTAAVRLRVAELA